MEENSIEEDIILLKDFTEGNFKRDKLENYKGSYKMGYFYYKNIQQAIEHILSDYKRVLKENECLKNHVHYKNCIACGKEFKSKRDDAKYCIKCSKQIANKNYIANLTEEQKSKRREQAKLAMRKLRANRK